MKIFRKIRLQFINQKSISKYLLYAIGEILLVVLGILIAVGINKWNIERNNRVQEVKILHQLKADFEANLNEIDEKIAMRNLMMEAAEKLIGFIDNGIDNIPLDTLSLYFGRTRYDPTFDGANGVVLELLNSGKLYLISNNQLKNHLTSWTGNVSKLAEQETLMAESINTRYIPYWVENFKGRHFIANRDKTMDKFFMKSDSKVFSVKRELKREVFENYLNDPVIESYLIYIGDLSFVTNKMSLVLKEKILEVLEIVESELSKAKS